MSIIGVVLTLAELIVVVLTGGIDISVGSALGLAAVLSCGPVRRSVGAAPHWSWPSSSAALVGAVNGWLVAFRGLEPFIVTLGMLALARGLVDAYGNGIPIIPAAAATYAHLGTNNHPGLPDPGHHLACWRWRPIGFLLNRTVWGRRVYAARLQQGSGTQLGHPGQERSCGRSTSWAGLLVGLGGWMFLCRFPQRPSTAGNLMELEAIAAVVIGGARVVRRLRQGLRRRRRHHHLRR